MGEILKLRPRRRDERSTQGLLQYGNNPDAPVIDFNDPTQNGGDTHWLAQPRRRPAKRIFFVVFAIRLHLRRMGGDTGAGHPQEMA